MQLGANEGDAETDNYLAWSDELARWRLDLPVKVIGLLDGQEAVMQISPAADPVVYSTAFQGAFLDPFDADTWRGKPLSEVEGTLQPAPMRFYGSLAAWWDAQDGTIPKLG
jgi:hypothetical protein